jgi:hypothetical protein
MGEEEKMQTIKKINEVLKCFNLTFDLEARIVDEGGDLVASGLQIKEIKSDGHEFVNVLYDVFNAIIESVSDEHELIYNESRGLVIAKRVVKTDFIIEDI